MNYGKYKKAMTGTNDLKLPIYLDYQSTTPADPRVVDAMLPYFFDKPGNPHSRSHGLGREAHDAVEAARIKIASTIGSDAREIIFTSGATESNNLALKGAAQFYGDTKRQIITVATEHKCVIETCQHLASNGYDIVFLPVQMNGLLDLDRLAGEVTHDTLLVSIMAAHNEIGVIQQISDIGELCREHDVLFHTDSAQAVGKIPMDVNAMSIDLMSISGHKLYGPKGIGALYVRRRPRVRLSAQISGGGQERGLRSGTLPTPLCVGLGTACDIASEELGEEARRIGALRDHLYRGISDRLSDVILNGDPVHRLPGNLNLSFAGLDSEEIMSALPDIAISSGSACTSTSLEPSYVIRALGLSEDMARGSLRFGIGRFTTIAEIDYVIERVSTTVLSLRDQRTTTHTATSQVG
ncbi:MAG: Cysteine desulfurase IscS [Alphaproteobacteria bacterium MarineAlpha9_Bin7]|nr:MAG: Cysteine desulfurase IscS [Alphaproteobacteria bacterium MarineAlpha9_Bin7]